MCQYPCRLPLALRAPSEAGALLNTHDGHDETGPLGAGGYDMYSRDYEREQWEWCACVRTAACPCVRT